MMPSNGTGEALLPWSINTVYSYHGCSYKHVAVVDLYNEMRVIINGKTD